MMSPETGRQVDFEPIGEGEERGQTLLADDTVVETRIVLADLLIMGEDMLGPQVAINPVIALRTKCSPKVMEMFKDKPFPPATPIPFTPEGGFEIIDIVKVLKPTQSSYKFEKYTITISLKIDSVARNKLYKIINGGPIYNVRWTTNYKVAMV